MADQQSDNGGILNWLKQPYYYNQGIINPSENSAWNPFGGTQQPGQGTQQSPQQGSQQQSGQSQQQQRQPQQPDVSKLLGLIAPAYGIGALTGNPGYGAIAGAGVNALYQYFNQKYGGGGSSNNSDSYANQVAAANYNLSPTTTVTPDQWAAYDAGRV